MKICLISFSNNADHQNVVYSMFNVLYGKEDVYTVGIIDPKSSIAPHTERNFYYNCPQRPGINKDTFRLNVLFAIAKMIKDNHIDCLYFESQHLWNAMLMMLCPKCKKVVAVHDVIPHDGNRAMDLSNYVTCHMSDHIILRNKKYYETLSARYKISKNKITCIDLWRYWPPKKPIKHTGIFLCFGRIRKYKGFDLLLQIIQKTPHVNYQIVGSPDEESKQIVEQLKSYNNVSVVDREVTDAEMESYFDNADWIILPYSEATQSGVIVDAYKYSRPIISFNVGAISEQVVDGVTGFLVKEKNTNKFSELLIELSNMNNEELIRFSESAYEYGRMHYSAECAYRSFIEVMVQISK